MKNSHLHILYLPIAVLLLAASAWSANVGPGGYTNSFGTQPPAADWATLSVAGGGSDSYDMVAHVNANISAAGVTAQTTSNASSPPTQLATATWSSSGLYLQTRPTGNRYTVLMAKLVNNTATNATEVALSFLQSFGGNSTAEDAGMGTKLFYSLSGLTNSWVNLAALNTTVTSGSSTVGTNITLNWTNGGMLYLLWADDNNNGGTDAGYQVDDFVLQVKAGLPPVLWCSVTAPANNAVVSAGVPLMSAAAVAYGVPPYSVQYFMNSGAGNTVFNPAGTSTEAPYSVSLGNLTAGVYNIYAVVTDAEGSATSLTNTFTAADPVAITLTTPADGATFDNTTAVIGAATVTGGVPPYSVQFYLDNAASGAPVTSAPYTRDFGPLFVGSHTIKATVRDATGWTAESLVSRVTITGPLAVLLFPTNGTTYNFGQEVTLTAAPGGGTPPYIVTILDINGGAYAAVTGPLYSTNLGIWPVGSYTCYVHATDSSVVTQHAYSETNVITILPNPLVVTLTSPTNNQNVGTNVVFSVAANVAVQAPVTVQGVDFYYDGVFLGSDTTAPYSVLVPERVLGSHTVFALAIDSLGRTASSATNQMNFIVDPLANDNFANRLTLTGPAVTVTGNNTGATTEPGEPTGSGFTTWGATLWWKWVAPANGQVVIDTTGSSFNTGQGVFTGSAVNALTQVAFTGSAFGQQARQVTFTAVQGTEYQIVIAGMRGFGPGGGTPATGSITFTLQMPPSVSITSPTNRSMIMAGSNYVITADASSPNGGVAQVEFYRGNTLIGVDTNAPYSIEHVDPPAGTNILTAVVRDNAGLSATSASVSVLVANEGITIVSPLEDSYFFGVNSITVSTFVLLPTGTITNVEFYVDGQWFARDTNAPFSGVWSNLTGGSHRLTAVAQDDAGNTHNSNPVNIGVGTTLISRGAVWRYLDDGSNQGTNWVLPNFNDSSWASGPAELGYGDGDEATEINGGESGTFFITTYFRRTFVVDNPSSFFALVLNVKRDDGAVVYLNGQEAARFNMNPGPVDYLTQAPNAADDGANYEAAAVLNSFLVPGTNVIAVELHQTNPTSSDTSFDMDLIGVPTIIHNKAPLLAVEGPANNAVVLRPASISFDVVATDEDGVITKIEFFDGNTLLGQSSTSPFQFVVGDVAEGTHVYRIVATDDLNTATTVTRTVHAHDTAAGWKAFNDQAAGRGTHPNATAWDAFGTEYGAPGFGGTLRNIQTGAALPVSLTVQAVGASGSTSAGAPPAGTPAYDLFNGYVYFGSGKVGNHAIVLNSGSVVRHVFTGLDPAGRYSFRATAVQGNAAYSNRWTVCSLLDAEGFAPAHTANVLTSAQQPGALAAHQAAFNSGDNRTGDVVGWDDIAPGADGSITIASARYLGPAPGNSQPGSVAYAPVAVSLGTVAALPIVRLTQPLPGFTIQGPTNFLVSAVSHTVPDLAGIDFYSDGVLIGSASTSPGTLNWTNGPFGTHALTAVACDALGLCSTSPPVAVTITIPPTNTVAPAIFSQTPADYGIISNLTSITVIFTEPVLGVNASDLLINDVPATGVTGSGSNFVFTFPQPQYGVVQVRFAPDHGISDAGWPAYLPFDEEGSGASWSYSLIDRTSPTVFAKTPAAGATVTNLTEINVVFSEPVTGVNASDLLLNGTPAYAVSGGGSNYTFSVSQPATTNVLTVNVSWASTHGIVDTAQAQNPFNRLGVGATWTYSLDAKTILIESNSFWNFVKGTNEASLPTNAWRMLSFDDSSWSNAPAPFFYGDPYSNGVPFYTLLSDMRSNYTCIYLRKTFEVAHPEKLNNLYVRGQIDDGMIVWINGVEVLRTNVAAGEISYTSTAAGFTVQENGGVQYRVYPLPHPRNYLVPGTNVIAVHALNENLNTSSDFGFNAQLYTYLSNTEAAAPQVARTDPAAGFVDRLTNIVVVFSEPVTNVDAADLLINGETAVSVVNVSNLSFRFTFPQPAFGAVDITWAANHGIVDLDVVPKPFDTSVPGATWSYYLLNAAAPYVANVLPATNGIVNQLTQITVFFNEPVNGIDASDLLINGVPASAMDGSEDTFTFTFPQPAYGSVAVTWAENHGIQDEQSPPVGFQTIRPGNTWSYVLVDQTRPAIASQNPPAGASVTNLTQLSVTFTEPVNGVNASDLLLNGIAATGVTGTNGTYSFTFAQPNSSVINVRWAVNHGITDRATTPNSFDAGAAGATWSYQTLDNVAPRLASVVPEASSAVRSLRKVSLAFDEPVLGLQPASLTINGTPAQQMSGLGAGPYQFTFPQPETTGLVQVALSGAIFDLAAQPNPYLGSNWTYTLNTNLPLPSITRGPYLQMATPTSIIVRWRTGTASDSRVRFGLSETNLDVVVEDGVATTEHIVTLTNLTPLTRYWYSVGTTDSDLTNGVDFTFRTHPTNPVPTRIWFVSDYGQGDANEREVRDSYFSQVEAVRPADVFITGGDNDQIQGQDASYNNTVFGATYAYGALMRKLPMWPTIGNHDNMTSQGGPFYTAFSMPTLGEAGGVPSGTERYFSFNYGDIHFINLDSIDGTMSVSSDTPMTRWLREDLAAATQTWIIAYWHGPPYSKGSHDSDSTTDTLAWMTRMRENILPILEAYGVDLVLTGHSHVYERTWQLFGHYGFSTSFSESHKVDPGDGKMDGDGAYERRDGSVGTVYITGAVGGQPRDSQPGVKHPAHLLKKSGILGSLIIDVEGGKLDLKYINTSGGVEDYFSILKGSAIAPQMVIWKAAGAANVSWPASAEGYLLRFTRDNMPGAQWQTITNGITIQGDNKVFSFDPTNNGPAGYFRLMKP